MNGIAAPFRSIADWPSIEQENADRIIAFWRSEGALTDEAAMAKRVRQVVLHAVDAEGCVAGVCTALASTLPPLGQPMYFWRAFIGARWRTTPLVMSLLKRSCALLGEYAIARDYPCIGVLLELENARFREKGRMATWRNPRFSYIGRSARGLDLRAHYFKGAKLKSMP